MNAKTGLILLFFTLFLSSAPVFGQVGNIGNNVYGLYSETYSGIIFDTRNSTSDGTNFTNPDGGTFNPEGNGFNIQVCTGNTGYWQVCLDTWQWNSSLYPDTPWWVGGGTNTSNVHAPKNIYPAEPFWQPFGWASNYYYVVQIQPNDPFWDTTLLRDVTIPTEGDHCVRVDYGFWYDTYSYTQANRLRTNAYTGWNIQFGSPTAVATDMSAYNNGTVEFDIKMTTDIYFGIQCSTGSYPYVASSSVSLNLGLAAVPLTPSPPLGTYHPGFGTGGWTHVSLPISSFGLDLTSITVPARFDLALHEYGIFWVDNVVWKKASVGSGSLGIMLKNINDNITTGQISWSGVTPGVTRWKAADQYFQLDLTYYQPNWGIQIYTDNCAADANPQFLGVAGSTLNPAGLLSCVPGVSVSSYTIPMCWRIIDVSTTTDVLNIQELDQFDGHTSSSSLYSPILGSGFHCFLWMKDKSTPDIPSQNVTHFSDGDSYVTMWDAAGIQYGENTWGTAPTPNYVYLGANFSTALTPRVYKTSKLTIELFYE